MILCAKKPFGGFLSQDAVFARQYNDASLSRFHRSRIITSTMKTHRIDVSIFLVGLILTVAGCSDGNVSVVEGAITVDDKPVKKGTVSFTSLDGGMPASADIGDGKYRADTVPRGRVVVHLNAFELTGKKYMELGIEYPEEKNVIPPEYANGITLNVGEPKMIHDFHLKSK